VICFSIANFSRRCTSPERFVLTFITERVVLFLLLYILTSECIMKCCNDYCLPGTSTWAAAQGENTLRITKARERTETSAQKAWARITAASSCSGSSSSSICWWTEQWPVDWFRFDEVCTVVTDLLRHNARGCTEKRIVFILHNCLPTDHDERNRSLANHGSWRNGIRQCWTLHVNTSSVNSLLFVFD
jgi:hypothetical protein